MAGRNTPVVLLFICATLVCLIAQQAAGCINNCSGQGHCDVQKQECKCNTGRAGVDCSIVAGSLQAGQSLGNQVVPNRGWVYYYTTDNGQPNDRAGEFTWTVHSLTSGDVDIFIQKDRLPTRSDFLARNITNAPNFTVTANRNFQGTFYIGIYCFSGRPTVTFNISVQSGADCPQNCNNHGQCTQHHKCQCLPDWTGESCSEFIKQLEYGKKVSSSVRSGTWKYFRINALVENTLRVIVNQTSATGDVDMYIRYNSAPTLTAFDMVETTLKKDFYLDIQLDNNHFGNWLIGIYGITQTTFDIHYTQYSDCPNLCSMHGVCSTQGCTCSPGYSGTYCDTKTADLKDGEIIKGYVSDSTWNYYTYTPKSTAEFVISVNQTGHAVGQDCDVYARRGAKPTDTHFDARDISADPKVTLRIPDAGFSKWHIGVFGFSTCTYFISASSSTQCPPCGTHGTCSKEGVCVCAPGWSGDTCNKTVVQITNFSQPITGSLAPGQWDYFTVQGIQGRYLTAHLLELDTEGAFWLFMNPKLPPTLTNYNRTLSDKESNTNHHGISTEVNSADLWYVGVYGSPFALDNQAHPYKLQVWESPFRR